MSASTVVHHGSFNTLTNTYTAILKRIPDTSYRIAAPERENIYSGIYPTRQDDPSYVTEVQGPVEKIG